MCERDYDRDHRDDAIRIDAGDLDFEDRAELTELLEAVAEAFISKRSRARIAARHAARSPMNVKQMFQMLGGSVDNPSVAIPSPVGGGK